MEREITREMDEWIQGLAVCHLVDVGPKLIILLTVLEAAVHCVFTELFAIVCAGLLL